MDITKLNRFTQLPILIDFLLNQKIILLDPSNWDDKNDTLVIEEYKKQMHVNKVFALCFTHKSETIHHWKTFANGSSGCCIEFDAQGLIEIFNRDKNLRHGPVRYLKINNIKNPDIAIHDFPFIKRLPYKFENEYRLLWEGTTANNCIEIFIPLILIKKITFSQQMPESIFLSVKKTLVNNFNISHDKINRSTVYENQKWITNFRDDI